MKAQEQERIRIAGELHDSVMQQIAALEPRAGNGEAAGSRPTSEAKEMVARRPAQS